MASTALYPGPGIELQVRDQRVGRLTGRTERCGESESRPFHEDVVERGIFRRKLIGPSHDEGVARPDVASQTQASRVA